MIDNVTDLQAYREAQEPHLCGDARCLCCGHVWIAVAPLGTTALECPECRTMKGVFLRLVWRPTIENWQCDCGNVFFTVCKEGVYCPNCGVWQNFDDGPEAG